MKILYFTDGAGIDLQSIRSSLIRVPEVLTSVKQGQQEAKFLDLLNLFYIPDEEFRILPKVLRSYIVNLVQRGLHQRWVNRGHQADLVLRKINHRNVDELKSHFLAAVERFQANPLTSESLSLTSLIGKTEIFVIGPGFDELELWLRKEFIPNNPSPMQVTEVIGADPHLNWFWSEVRAGFSPNEIEAH